MPPPDPWDAPAQRTPPNQPLPKLDELIRWGLRQVAPYVGQALYGWDAQKLNDIRDQYDPVKVAGGMGCMLAAYGMLGILYGDKKSEALFKQVYKNAHDKAKAWAKKDPAALAQFVQRAHDDAAAKNKPPLTDKQAKDKAIHMMTSPFNSSDHLFALMREQGLAGDRVKTPSADAEQAIAQMAGGGPGVYFFGMAVNDNHTVTLAVERAADGSHKMFWFDQNEPGLNHEVPAGQLGSELQNVHGHTNTTHIWAFRQPEPSGSK
jgi:hypothetical protein